jgi:hypothetical protein
MKSTALSAGGKDFGLTVPRKMRRNEMPETTFLCKVEAANQEQLVRALSPWQAACIARSFFEEIGVNITEARVSPLREPRTDADDGLLRIGIVYEPTGLDREYRFQLVKGLNCTKANKRG